MLAFIISQLTGLAAKILIAGSFSAGVELDAFYAANRPSETLVTIMAGGILVSSFIPIFVKFLVREDRRSAWKLASATANLILVLTSLLAGLAALFAGPIVEYILGAGFSPDKQALTISLLRIQTISIVFFGLSGLAVGVLNSNQKFLMPALGPGHVPVGTDFWRPGPGSPHGHLWIGLGGCDWFSIQSAYPDSFSVKIERSVFSHLWAARFFRR